MKKIINLLLIGFIFLTACTSQPTFDPNNFEQSVEELKMNMPSYDSEKPRIISLTNDDGGFGYFAAPVISSETAQDILRWLGYKEKDQILDYVANYDRREEIRAEHNAGYNSLKEKYFNAPFTNYESLSNLQKENDDDISWYNKDVKRNDLYYDKHGNIHVQYQHDLIIEISRFENRRQNLNWTISLYHSDSSKD